MKRDQVFDRLNAWLLRRNNLTAVRRVADLQIAVATDIGALRKENQDKAAVMRAIGASGRSYVLCALSDGMGGMADGAVCAAMTIAAFFTDFAFRFRNDDVDPSKSLLEATLHANDVVSSRYHGQGGATLSALLIAADNHCQWVNVGDSRIYLANREALIQVTIDDTLDGQLPHRDGNGHSGRNQLLQFVGFGSGLEPHVDHLPTDPEVRMVLTSDGVHYLPHAVLGGIIKHATDVGTVAKRLVDVARWCGGHDNASAIVVSSTLIATQPEPSLDTSVCEFWDSFGEVQIIGIPSALPNPKSPLPPQAAEKIGAPLTAQASMSPAGQALVEQEQAEQETTRRDAGNVVPPKQKRPAKKARKETVKKNLSPDKPSSPIKQTGGDHDDPQLGLKIEFPNKS
ncbi:hypothetical protein [Caballeronia sp. KNU42]